MTVITGGFPPSPGSTEIPAVDLEVSPTTLPFGGPLWRTIMDKVRSFTVEHGRNTELDRPKAGKHRTRVSNWGREVDPTNTAPPYGASVRPQNRVRMLARWAGVTYPLWAGYADGWPQSFQGSFDAYVDLASTDVFKLLGRVSLPTSMYEFAVSQDRPSHWWKLNEPAGASTALDSGFSGTSANATILGAPVMGTTAIIPFDGGNTCAAFSTANYVQLPSGVTGGASTYSIEGWFTHSNTGKLDAICTFGDWITPGNVNNIAVYINGSGQLLCGLMVPAGARVDDGLPHHFVLTATTVANASVLYVDGVSYNTGSATVHSLAQTTSSLIASAGTQVTSVSDVGFNGTISHIAFYAGVVLTAAQVANHYKAGKTAFAGDDTGTFAGRLLDYARIPASERNIRTGSSTIGGYELPGGFVLDLLLKLADTEQGQCFVDNLGRVTWTPRYGLLTDIRSTVSQATFDQTRFTAIQFGYDEVDVLNDVNVTRQGGVLQHVVDQAAIDVGTVQSFIQTGYLYASDNQAYDLASWILYHHKLATLRISALTVTPGLDPATLWPLVLGLGIGDRITVALTPKAGGYQPGAAPVEAPGTPPVLGYAAWYDAADPSTITSSGGLVSQLNDKSGHGYNLTAAGAARPTTGVDTIAGLNVLKFAGAQSLVNTSINVAQPGTVFVVQKQNPVSSNTFVFDASPDVGATGPLLGLLTSHWRYGAGTLFSGAAVPDTTPHVHSIVFNGASSAGYIDGAFDASGNWGAAALAGLSLGNGANGGAGLIGDIAEFIVYPGALSTSDRRAVEVYLQTKWSGHQGTTDCIIQGIAHSAPEHAPWTVTYQLSIAADTLPFWIFDTSHFDVDTNFAF